MWVRKYLVNDTDQSLKLCSKITLFSSIFTIKYINENYINEMVWKILLDFWPLQHGGH